MNPFQYVALRQNNIECQRHIIKISPYRKGCLLFVAERRIKYLLKRDSFESIHGRQPDEAESDVSAIAKGDGWKTGRAFAKKSFW